MKCGYADDLTILLRRPSWKGTEKGLNKDMTILVDYLRTWRLQISTCKTVSASYHLNNREAKGNWTCLSITNTSDIFKVRWPASGTDAELQTTP